MRTKVIKTSHSFGPNKELGLEYAGVVLELECGHIKKWDGGYPVPFPMPDEEVECDLEHTRQAW
jgi:hypothetical protein